MTFRAETALLQVLVCIIQGPYFGTSYAKCKRCLRKRGLCAKGRINRLDFVFASSTSLTNMPTCEHFNILIKVNKGGSQRPYLKDPQGCTRPVSRRGHGHADGEATALDDMRHHAQPDSTIDAKLHRLHRPETR